MIKQKVILRVDGNGNIGLGHISRCCALAEMLNDNFALYFFTRADSQTVINNIKNYCKNVFVLNDKISYAEEAIEWTSFLSGDEIVVLDGYNFNTNYQQHIKSKGCKLVCVDDIHAYHFIADIVINHAPGVTIDDYSVEQYTQLYLGGDYVLLKKIFLDAALNKPTSFDLAASPVLVCFGGADPDNITMQTLEETMCLFPEKKINVVVGAAFNHMEALAAIADTSNLIKMHVNINSLEMFSLMAQSHIAITSASTVAFEYMCIKGILFLKCIANNQKEIYASLIEKQCAYPFELLKKKYFSTENICNQQRVIDGKSRQRLLAIFKELAHKHNILQFKKAGKADADILFNWINDEEVRVQSLSKNNISYSEHTSWFSKKLADKNCYLYIIYKSNSAVGMIRFDINDNNCMISYLVDKSERGKGMGALIIQEGIKHFKEDSNFKGCLKATVRSTNIASLKIFERAGFEKENIKEDLVFFKANQGCQSK